MGLLLCIASHYSNEYDVALVTREPSAESVLVQGFSSLWFSDSSTRNVAFVFFSNDANMKMALAASATANGPSLLQMTPWLSNDAIATTCDCPRQHKPGKTSSHTPPDTIVQVSG